MINRILGYLMLIYTIPAGWTVLLITFIIVIRCKEDYRGLSPADRELAIIKDTREIYHMIRDKYKLLCILFNASVWFLIIYNFIK